MRTLVVVLGLGLGALALGACGPGPRLPATLGQVDGTLAPPGTGRGDALLFLYGPGEGSPASQAVPRYVTAVSEPRLGAGDGHFVFSGVQPGPYRLWGFLDANRNFHGELDVLAQPGAGDRPVTAGVELTVGAGENVGADLTLGAPYVDEPPAFHVETDELPTELPDQPLRLVTLTLVADGLGLLDASRVRFSVSLQDANGDGQADDANGDGVPDLSPQLFLRFLPKPGQTVPTDDQGRKLEVIVPLLYNPAPFLAVLGGDVTRSVSADQLQAFVVPQAQGLMPVPGQPPILTALAAIPVGDYELWAQERAGRFWRVPNALGGASAADVGGPFPSQAVRFGFVHGTGLGGPAGPPP